MLRTFFCSLLVLCVLGLVGAGCVSTLSCPDGMSNVDGVCRPSDGGMPDGGCASMTFYADTDEDGFGDRSSSMTACSAPDGFVTDNTDCDDTTMARRPGGTEICDNIDNDCNEVVDDGDAAMSCTAGANGTPTCAAGVCGNACESNFADCSDEAGCETTLGTLEHCTGCGACGWACDSSVEGCNDLRSISTHDQPHGGSTSCAVRRDGTAYCWGTNNRGQVGDGTTDDVSRPVPVVGLPSGYVLDVAAGAQHSCAIVGASASASSGPVYCWGANGVGQLGDDTMNPSLTPVAVSGLTNAVDIDAGTDFTCARTAGGTVRCWGLNGTGQLGGGSSLPIVGVPIAVPFVSDAVALDVGDNRACVARGPGGVLCWGTGVVGGETFFSAGVDAIAIAVGREHFCAVTRSAADFGAVYCWGENRLGQLGNGTMDASSVPVRLTGFGGTTATSPEVATHVALGFFHSCARTVAGTVSCWGAGGYIGDGASMTRLTPTMVTGLTGASSLVASGNYACSVARGATDDPSAGRGWCWGQGALGDGTDFVLAESPVAVLAPL